MTLLEFYGKIMAMNSPIIQTRDVAVQCNITNPHASQLLSRLTKHGRLISIARGKYVLAESTDLLALPYYLTMPFPCYISLQSALYYHGMISQIPEIIYAISIARTRRYTNTLATVSIHHIQPEFYFGYTQIKEHVFLASPEKALIDYLYLSQAKSQLFGKLPELTLDSNFSFAKAEKIINKISYKNRKAHVLGLFLKIRIKMEL